MYMYSFKETSFKRQLFSSPASLKRGGVQRFPPPRVSVALWFVLALLPTLLFLENIALRPASHFPIPSPDSSISPIWLAAAAATLPPPPHICIVLAGAIADLGFTYNFNQGQTAFFQKVHNMALNDSSIVFTTEIFPRGNYRDLPTRLALGRSLVVERGCRVIVSQSVEMGELALAQAYPNITVFRYSYPDNNNPLPSPNHRYFNQRLDRPYFTAGTAAAQYAKTCIGFMTAWEDKPDAEQGTNGFIMGVRSVNATIPLHVVTMNSWYKPLADHHAADIFLSLGCEVVARYADPHEMNIVVDVYNYTELKTDRGVVADSADLTKKLHLTPANVRPTQVRPLSLGAHSDTAAVVGNSVLTSVYKDWVPLLEAMILPIILNRSKTIPDRDFFIGILEGNELVQPIINDVDIDIKQLNERTKGIFGTVNASIYCGRLVRRDGTVAVDQPAWQCLNATTPLGGFVAGATFHPIPFPDVDKCPAGTFPLMTTTPLITMRCTPCPPGTYSAGGAQLRCLRCPEGKIAPDAGTSECVNPPSYTLFYILGGLFGAIVAFGAVVVAVLVWRMVRSKRDLSLAPSDPDRHFAIVFTDIESSTTLWARMPVTMAQAIDVHHTVIRAAIAKHHGYEVKTIGDAFMIAFRSAVDAAAFATDLQHDLQRAPWPEPEVISDVYRDIYIDHVAVLAAASPTAGMSPTGLCPPHSDALIATTADPPPPHHQRRSSQQQDVLAAFESRYTIGLRVRVGANFGAGNILVDPVTRAYDYYGTVVNTAARIEAVGHGGQVLFGRSLVAALAELAGDDMKTIESSTAPSPATHKKGQPKVAPVNGSASAGISSDGDRRHALRVATGAVSGRRWWPSWCCCSSQHWHPSRPRVNRRSSPTSSSDSSGSTDLPTNRRRPSSGSSRGPDTDADAFAVALLVEPLGEQHLRGLDETVFIFQVCTEPMPCSSGSHERSVAGNNEATRTATEDIIAEIATRKFPPLRLDHAATTTFTDDPEHAAGKAATNSAGPSDHHSNVPSEWGGTAPVSRTASSLGHASSQHDVGSERAPFLRAMEGQSPSNAVLEFDQASKHSHGSCYSARENATPAPDEDGLAAGAGGAGGKTEPHRAGAYRTNRHSAQHYAQFVLSSALVEQCRDYAAKHPYAAAATAGAGTGTAFPPTTVGPTMTPSGATFGVQDVGEGAATSRHTADLETEDNDVYSIHCAGSHSGPGSFIHGPGKRARSMRQASVGSNSANAPGDHKRGGFSSSMTEDPQAVQAPITKSTPAAAAAGGGGGSILFSPPHYNGGAEDNDAEDKLSPVASMAGSPRENMLLLSTSGAPGPLRPPSQRSASASVSSSNASTTEAPATTGGVAGRTASYGRAQRHGHVPVVTLVAPHDPAGPSQHEHACREDMPFHLGATTTSVMSGPDSNTTGGGGSMSPRTPRALPIPALKAAAGDAPFLPVAQQSSSGGFGLASARGPDSAHRPRHDRRTSRPHPAASLAHLLASVYAVKGALLTLSVAEQARHVAAIGQGLRISPPPRWAATLQAVMSVGGSGGGSPASANTGSAAVSSTLKQQQQHLTAAMAALIDAYLVSIACRSAPIAYQMQQQQQPTSSLIR